MAAPGAQVARNYIRQDSGMLWKDGPSSSSYHLPPAAVVPGAGNECVVDTEVGFIEILVYQNFAGFAGRESL